MPTKYTIEDAAPAPKYTIEDSTIPPTPPQPEGFWSSLGHTFGIGSDEAKAAQQEFQQHPILSTLKQIVGGPALQAGQGLYNEFMRSTGEAGQAVDAALKDRNPYAAAEHGMYAVPLVGAGIKRGVEQLGPDEWINPGELGTATGTAIQTAPSVADVGPLTRPFKAAAGIVPKMARGGLDILAGTTPKVATELGESTAEANAAAQAKANEANAAQAETRSQQLRKHFEKTQQVRAQNEAAQAVQSRKAALERGVEQLDPEFQEDLKATEKNVRAQANAKYDTVRAAVGDATVPSDSLAQAVKKAESSIEGSNENLKVFRDILSKAPTGEDFVESGGAKFGPGTSIYESVKASPEGIPGAAKPFTFADLQGYYSELGRQLSRGNLPGDVYHATKTLQGSIGDLMQEMADSRGVGDQLKEARGFYRDYLAAFRDSSSPLVKAMNATERGGAIKALQGKDQSGVGTLAKYNPELAQRANTIRGYQSEAKGITSKAPAVKPEPALPPKPEPIQPDLKKVGPEDIRNAKTEAMQKQADWIRRRGSLIASGYGAYHFLSSLMHGNLGGAMGAGFETGVGLTATQALARALESPRVVKYLTNPTPADIAAIPPEIRGDMPQIVKAAQSQGIKVHPALLLMGNQNAQPQQ